MKVLMITLALLSSGPWSLKDCIDYALDHNITVQKSANTVKDKEIALNTAQGRRLPNLSASASENFSFGRGIGEDNTYSNANTSTTGFSLSSSVPVFQGFDINNDIKLSRLNLAAATSDLAKAKDDIRVEVAKAYVQILYDKEILQVAENQAVTDSVLYDRLVSMRDVGKASVSDVVAQQATLAKSRLSVTQATNNLSLALLDLTQLLELSSPEGFDIVCPAEESLGIRLLMNPEEIYAAAVDSKPSIKSEELRLDYAKVSIDRAKGAYMPSLSLSGGIGSNYYTSSITTPLSFGEQIKNNFSQYLGLSLSIPIFSRFSTRNQVKSAEISYANQQLTLESARKNLYKEIQQAYYNAVAAQSKYLSSAEAEKSARASYELTKEKYENGKADIAEYNESENRYLEAASNYLQARYECLYQSSLLDFYRDGTLEF